MSKEKSQAEIEIEALEELLAAKAPPSPVDEGEESPSQFLQRVGMDGHKWAEEMHKRFREVPEDELLGWCCNMIMAGYDEAQRRAEKSQPLTPEERERTVDLFAQAKEALNVPEHKLNDAEFLRASVLIAKSALKALEAAGFVVGRG